MRLFGAGERAVDLNVFPSHASDSEAACESFSNSGAVEFSNAPNSRDGLGHVLDEVAGHSVIDNFRRGTEPESNHGSAAGHGFDHDQSERLWPIDWKKEGV